MAAHISDISPRGEEQVSTNQIRREPHSARGASLGLHKTIRGRATAHTMPEALVAELAELVRDLHELLESYAPPWYTQKMDSRVSIALGAADHVLCTSAERRRRHQAIASLV